MGNELTRAGWLRCATLLVALLVSSCMPEKEIFAIYNHASTEIRVFVGRTTDEAHRTSRASPGDSAGIPYPARETLVFGLITLHAASFAREFAAGLTIEDGRGRSIYLSLRDLENKRTHPKLSLYVMEIDERDFLP